MTQSTIYLFPSTKPTHKYTVVVDGKTIHFGAQGYDDYTKHKDNARKFRYIKRHKVRENWNKSGIKTAGFWSRWVLWNKPSITESIEDLKNRFSVKIIRRRPPSHR